MNDWPGVWEFFASMRRHPATRDLSVSQQYLVTTLATFDTPPCQRDVARKAGMSRQNVSEMVKTLAAAGLVVRLGPDEDDTRLQRICLTENGREVANALSVMYRKAVKS